MAQPLLASAQSLALSCNGNGNAVDASAKPVF
jgi:hypothetical protein